MSALFALVQRELIHYKKDFGRWIGVFVQPLLFWFLMSSGLSSLIKTEELSQTNFSQFFFIGNLTLSIVFTSAFCSMSLISDRKSGFLSALKNAPISSLTLVCVPLCGLFVLNTIQIALYFLLSSAIGFHIFQTSIGQLFLSGVLTSTCLGGLAVLLAWSLPSVHIYHALLTILIIPLWLISGAVFPLTEGWHVALAQLNPISHIVLTLRAGFAGSWHAQGNLTLALFSLVSVCFATWLVNKKRSAI